MGTQCSWIYFSPSHSVFEVQALLHFFFHLDLLFLKSQCSWIIFSLRSYVFRIPVLLLDFFSQRSSTFGIRMFLKFFSKIFCPWDPSILGYFFTKIFCSWNRSVVLGSFFPQRSSFLYLSLSFTTPAAISYRANE